MSGGVDRIDTEVTGSQGSIAAVATWLGSLADGMDAAVDDTVSARSKAAGAWTGASHDNYAGHVNAMVAESDPIAGLIRRCSTAVDEFGWELKACQDDMTRHRQRALSGGLQVSGYVIHKPTLLPRPTDLTGEPTPEQVQAHTQATQDYNRAQNRGTLYDQLCIDVRGTFDRVDTAVTAKLAPLETEVNTKSGLEQLLDTAQTAADYALEYGVTAFSVRATDLEKAATRAQTELARRRSGNPAVRAGTQAPSTQGMANARKPGTRAGNLASQSARARTIARFLKWGGPIIGIVSGIFAIANGESPGEVVVNLAAGIVGGILAGAAVAGIATLLGVTAPVWLTAAAVVAGGIALGAAATWAYQNWVPENVREAIDDGARAAWNWTTDRVSDVGEVASDVGGWISDKASGAWNWAFG